MKLFSIDTGFFKLDGGAMYGVVPKSMWQKKHPADENNLCSLAMRCLLIEDGKNLILIDNGVGDKQDFSFFKHYFLHGNGTLESSINQAGFSTNDITDVILTHLHFDHCGGGTKYATANRKRIELTFKNAKYWTNQKHWQWAIEPNKREKASFLKENLLPMQESGQLYFADKAQYKPFENIDLLFVNGHTEGQIIPHIKYKNKTIVFVADLIPCTGHLRIPFVTGYDVRPLVSMEEKEKFLSLALQNDYILFFEHDPYVECCSLTQGEKGVTQKDTFSLTEL